jgi:hypothetical protein
VVRHDNACGSTDRAIRDSSSGGPRRIDDRERDRLLKFHHPVLVTAFILIYMQVNA